MVLLCTNKHLVLGAPLLPLRMTTTCRLLTPFMPACGTRDFATKVAAATKANTTAAPAPPAEPLPADVEAQSNAASVATTAAGRGAGQASRYDLLFCAS
jgi:hypothetical protein